MNLGTWTPSWLRTRGHWRGLRNPETEESPSLSLAGQQGDWRLEQMDLLGVG